MYKIVLLIFIWQWVMIYQAVVIVIVICVRHIRLAYSTCGIWTVWL